MKDDRPVRPQRRVRYPGKNPRRFEEKYKEHDSQHYGETVARVLAAGKTPAGTHRPVMVAEIIEVLQPRPGLVGVDSTLGYGGHAAEILARLRPGGRLLGVDVDPIELPRTEARLRALGYEAEFTAHRSSFAALPRILAHAGLPGADLILADLGVSSMQLDDPARGFSMKHDGPLDMRMNPARGPSAAVLLRSLDPVKLSRLLAENADEPHAELLGAALAGHFFETTRSLATAVRAALKRLAEQDAELSVRRLFQALRIAVNDEFSALDAFLRQLPLCLNPGGRVAILTFHSGEDRRVKKAFVAGERAGIYCDISREIIRPSAAERSHNPRSASAKLRWARVPPIASAR